MSADRTAYQTLLARFSRILRLSDMQALLEWDSAVTMPSGAADSRNEVLGEAERLIHELLTAPDLPDLLDAAAAEEADDQTNDALRRSNLHHMRRQVLRARAVPADVQERFQAARLRCETVWRQARAEDDFPTLAPFLAEVVAATRERAQALAEMLDCSPYDALLDGFAPGGRRQRIDTLFAELKEFLPDLLQDAVKRQHGQARFSLPKVAVEAQRALSRDLMADMGFDFAHGRLDESLHPFTGGMPGDVRITARFDPANVLEGILAVLHETGHALLEQNRPPAWRAQPAGRMDSMVLHESQSLLFEKQVGRNRYFADYLAARLRDHAGGGWSGQRLHVLMTRVSPGPIRVEADEVSYPLHILLRYELEQALLCGDLQVRDLPGAWAEGMKASLGIMPQTDRDGCMQDIHWMYGLFGYFPTYVLGAMAAAQIFKAAEDALGPLDGALAGGDLSGLLDWLVRSMYARPQPADTDEMMMALTGAPLSAAAYRDHLLGRYGGDV